MSRSVLVRVICTLDMKVRKNAQEPYISFSVSPRPASRAAASPLPTPYQPGRMIRDWVQPKTHGMARRSSRPPSPPGRLEGREPMFILPSSSTGVAETKKGTSASSRTRAR